MTITPQSMTGGGWVAVSAAALLVLMAALIYWSTIE